eukprot:TRINITY_DN899_c0_g1_i1.p1 TRINITY_DN899_c0_g1~~TRINITY_DN899_c0_g1_i1.p1  ORF type:complete len:539 (-),score=141.37 TRINITY_DN899_c0_g1_i1:69-1568(-)
MANSMVFVLLSALAVGTNGLFLQLFFPWFFERPSPSFSFHPLYENVVDAAIQTDGLGSLVAAVQAAGLVDTLQDPHLQATVFAPTDAAFDEAAAALNITLEELLIDTETLTTVLQYHVVPERLPASHLFNGLDLPTLAGDGLDLIVSNKYSGISIKAIGSEANVLVADVTAGSAIVHVIDTVLLPLSLDATTMAETMADMGPMFATIVEAAQAADTLETLVAAVVAADLVDTLSDSELSATVFAPTNEAFQKALATLGTTLEEFVSNVDTLSTVLTYHVVPVKALSTDLSDGQVLSTLAGDDLTLTVDLSDGVAIQAVGSKANVVQADITAGSGVVHVVDSVLLPFAIEVAPTFGSIVEAAVSSDTLSTLVAAVTAAGLADTLSDPELEATVFAPTDAAFEDALTLLGLSLEELVEDLDTLTLVLQYHVVPVKALSTDLVNGQVLPTLAGNSTLTVDLSDGVDIVGIGSTAKVIDADITAGAGVVHVIDTVLLPIEPTS